MQGHGPEETINTVKKNLTIKGETSVVLLMAPIIHRRANEPSTFTARSQSHKSALIAVPLWNKLPRDATMRSNARLTFFPPIPRVTV